MRIIALQGKSNSGKTTILKHLIRKINSIPAEPILHSLKYRYSMTLERFDAWAVYNNVKGKVVAVITSGDQKKYVETIYNSILAKYKKKFDKDLVLDILVVASHNNEEMNTWLKTLSEGNLETVTKDYLDKKIKGKPTDVARAEEIFKLI